MSLVEVYSNQYPWRRWAEIYPALGELAGLHLIDLGCGVGDQARDLSQLGAHVLGIDAQQDVIAYASARDIPRARFICDQITNVPNHTPQADGVWASFTAAYFPHFDALLRPIAQVLRPGGWLAIIELDGLFDHDPLDVGWHTLIEEYYAQSLAEGVYRFRSHHHVQTVLAEQGWQLARDVTLDDDEFCFTGPAIPAVAAAWQHRLSNMMSRFVARFGDRAAGLDTALLSALQSPEHRSRSQVWFSLAQKPGGVG